jgi:hypothetical protein
MTPFNPGDIVRYGKDNAIYVRAINGSWYAVDIGYPENKGKPEGYESWGDDTAIAGSIENGFASVVYLSPGHYWDELLNL